MLVTAHGIGKNLYFCVRCPKPNSRLLAHDWHWQCGLQSIWQLPIRTTWPCVDLSDWNSSPTLTAVPTFRQRPIFSKNWHKPLKKSAILRSINRLKAKIGAILWPFPCWVVFYRNSLSMLTKMCLCRFRDRARVACVAIAKTWTLLLIHSSFLLVLLPSLCLAVVSELDYWSIRYFVFCLWADQREHPKVPMPHPEGEEKTGYPFELSELIPSVTWRSNLFPISSLDLPFPVSFSIGDIQAVPGRSVAFTKNNGKQK